MFNIPIFKQEVTSILAGTMQIRQRPAYIVFVSYIALALSFFLSYWVPPSLCLLISKVLSKEKPASRFAALEAETNAAISMYRVGKKGSPEKGGQRIRRIERNKGERPHT